MPGDNQNKSGFPQSDLSQSLPSMPNDQAAGAPINTAATQTDPPMNPVGPIPQTDVPPQKNSILNPTTPSPSGTSTPPTFTDTSGQAPSSAPPPGDGSDSSVVTSSSHVPKKYGGQKVIATIFSILFIVGAVVAGVVLVQRQQLLEQEAASGSECQQASDCILLDNPGNSGSFNAPKTIKFVDITDQDVHTYNPGNNDDGCRRVNISGSSLTWERYGSGNTCKDVSNVQVWLSDSEASPTPLPTPIATTTPTPPLTPGVSATTTPTSSAVSCPVGTTALFANSGSLNVGTSVSFGGTVSSRDGSWSTGTRNGVKLAEGGSKITVNFPTNVYLDSALIYDNDPKSGENPWSINGTNLPTTSNNTWASLFKLDKTTNQMVFDNGGDSPHFNVCVKETTVSNTPTLPPQISAQCNKVNAYDVNGNQLSQAQLAQLSPGDSVLFAVSGQTSSGSFSKARFTVNGAQIGESTTKNAGGEYYIEYTIPDGVTNFSVKGEVFHSSLGWI